MERFLQKKVQQLNGIGVTGFVLGTSALFGKKDRYDEILNKLRMKQWRRNMN